MRDAAHRVLNGYNPTGDFYLRYDRRGRIDLFKFNEYASPANGGIRRVFKVRWGYSPDGPLANLQGLRQMLRAGASVGTGTVCGDCHFSAGLIDGAARGVAFVWRLAQNPAVRYGIGQGARKAAENWARLKERCKPAAETEVAAIPPGRVTSEYTDITVGRSTKNIETDVGKAEFEASLRNDGWEQTLTKDGNRYGVRDESNHGLPTADYFRVGEKDASVKIRLGGQ